MFFYVLVSVVDFCEEDFAEYHKYSSNVADPRPIVSSHSEAMRLDL